MTRINGGTADNIIPDTVVIGGTVRTYTAENRQKIHDRIGAIATKLSESEECTATVNYTFGYPSTVNTALHVEAISEMADLFTVRALR